MRAAPAGNESRDGSAIVITLIVVVVLSVIVTAFLSSMSIERLTAQSYENLVKAELTAEAGVSEALHRLTRSDLDAEDPADPGRKHFPVSAYEELPVGYKGSTYTAPYLTLLRPNPAWDGVKERRFLTATSDMTVAPPSAADADTTDINAVVDDLEYGWIGLRNEDGTRRVVPTEWIYLRDSHGQVVGRYTFWVDDESARVDAMTAGSVESSSGLSHQRLDGSAPSEVAAHGFFDDEQSVADFLQFRSSLGPSWRGILGFLQTPASVHWKQPLQSILASVTWGAKSDERGALGVRRLNLNTWVDKSRNFTTPSGRNEIAEKVVALGDFINAVDPEFGDRFYEGADDAARRQYCIKLAANIQDYIDTDHQPTVIRNNLEGWQEPPDPTQVGEGAPDSPPAAFGKEVVPAIGEYVAYYYNDGGALRIDHTFEIWNIHSKPIDLSQMGAVRILIAERNDVTPFQTGGTDPSLPGEPGNPPLALPLPNALISPDSYALFTTLPPGSAYDAQWVVNAPRRILLSRGEPSYPYGTVGFRMAGDQLATSADVDTEIVVANNFGYLDIQARVAQQGPSNLRASDGARVIASQSFGNVPTGSGNNAHRGYPLDSGDPRSFTEVHESYLESGGSASAIAWRRNTANSQTATRLGGESYNSGASGPTSGIIPDNSAGSSVSHVPEPTPSLNSSSALPVNAVSIIRDAPMHTVGELGFLYDPALSDPAKSGSYHNSVRKRGGFRTLAIGSRMGEKEGPNRLTHVNETNRASRLLELFTTNDRRDGVLLNSVLRDPANLPLRAILATLQTQTNDTPSAVYPAPRDKFLPPAGVTVSADNVIAGVKKHVGTPGASRPFLLLGQLADVDVFNTGYELFGGNFDMTPGARNKEVMDRGREEVFRHLVGLLTLKGSVFRIHAIGQAGRMSPAGKFIARGTHRTMRLYELDRRYPVADPLASTAMPALETNNRPTAVRVKQLAEIKQ